MNTEPIQNPQDSVSPEETTAQAVDLNEQEIQDVAATADEQAASGKADDSQTAAHDQVAQLQAQLDDLRDRLLRAVAETENTRKRLEKERQDTAKYAVSGFARGLLSVADNLRRALEAIPDQARAENQHLESIYVGVEATERELLRAFEAAGIKKIEPMDQLFDPNFHEVMFEAEAPGKAPGTIVQLVEAGYIIHDRLLRPARVGVARGDRSAAPGGSVDREV